MGASKVDAANRRTISLYVPDHARPAFEQILDEYLNGELTPIGQKGLQSGQSRLRRSGGYGAAQFSLAAREVFLHSVCELRFALREISISHPSFLRTNWAISITLTPKVDTQGTLNAGELVRAPHYLRPSFSITGPSAPHRA
jgi:hypothetical protein